jgi:UDP-N-acetylmuramoyl-tripeptide--D-alanyl-D-alanine ligase
VEVDDPEEALRVFAADHRQYAFKGTLVGLTGSNGKTSTKELLASALSQLGPTLATEGNFNNHLGVPLTLLRLRPQHRFAVVEMGMSARGEIATLAALARPQVGVITTIAAAHLEGLGSLEEIARAKGELFLALAPKEVAVFSSTLPFREVALEGVSAQQRLADELFELCEERVSVRGSEATLRLVKPDEAPPRDFKLTLALSGHHQLNNARLALVGGLAAAERLELEPSDELIEALCTGLSYCPAPHMRGEMIPLPVRGEHSSTEPQESWLWLDCYNANPQSTLTSLKTFWQAGLRGAIVLGALKELGARSDDLHRELGHEVARLALALTPSQSMPSQPILTMGDEARFIAEGLREGGYPLALITHLPSEGIAEAQALLCAVLSTHPYASLFVKGSRSGRLERLAELVIEQLKAPPHP